MQFKKKSEGFSFQLLGLPPHALQNLSHLEEIGIQLGKFKEKEGKEFGLSRTASVDGKDLCFFLYKREQCVSRDRLSRARSSPRLLSLLLQHRWTERIFPQ